MGLCPFSNFLHAFAWWMAWGDVPDCTHLSNAVFLSWLDGNGCPYDVLRVGLCTFSSLWPWLGRG